MPEPVHARPSELNAFVADLEARLAILSRPRLAAVPRNLQDAEPSSDQLA